LLDKNQVLFSHQKMYLGYYFAQVLGKGVGKLKGNFTTAVDGGILLVCVSVCVCLRVWSTLEEIM